MGCFASREEHTQKLSGFKPPAQQKKEQEENEVDIRSKSGRDLKQLDPEVKEKFNQSGPCEEFYEIGKVIGKGGFATVRHAVDKKTNEQYAIKIMEVAPAGQDVGGNDNTWADVIAEVAILCRLQHPNIIALREFFIQSNKVYLVTTLVKGGELLESVLQRGSYSEATAHACFKQLLEGVRYCHEHGVVHRDLKLENLLLEVEHDLTRILIVDFGLAKGHFQGRAMAMDTVCGTPHYVAPEVIQGGPGKRYGPEVDLWGCGVILFVLLSGNPPFYHEKDKALYELIRNGAFSFQDPVWDLISDEAKDLIQKLLVVDPSKRLTAAQALEHPWMAQHEDVKAPAGDLTGALDNLRIFHKGS